MPYVKLQSSDKETFEVDVEIAETFFAIKTMMDILETDNEPVVLSKVNSTILKMVIEWATYHKYDEQLMETQDIEEGYMCDMSSWDAEFFNVDLATLIHLTYVADYLDNWGLVDATCKAIANAMKDMKVVEMRTAFKIEDDLMNHVEEEVMEE